MAGAYPATAWLLHRNVKCLNPADAERLTKTLLGGPDLTTACGSRKPASCLSCRDREAVQPALRSLKTCPKAA